VSTTLPASLDATILIATYNRAAMLHETLLSLTRLQVRAGRTWEVIVIDNNSSDDTRAVVERVAPEFPVELRYVFEGRQGRSSALNTGITLARGKVLAFTDDDVQVAPVWLDAACDALNGDDPRLAYAGGPVRPIWETPPPAWLDRTRGDLWGTIAIQDHGPESFVYEERHRVPLGANMATRREFFDTVGTFRADLGRSSGTLVLGQEVPEILLRARQAGLRGVYVPAMEVHHHVPARRLTPAYFRKWWFGKGVSRAALERLQPVTESGVDLRRAPHLLRVPRHLYGAALRHATRWLAATGRRQAPEAFRCQMMLAFFCGYFWARRREGSNGAGLAPAYRGH
jgi:glycosyltransferase involved in cell wall biosynthesis